MKKFFRQDFFVLIPLLMLLSAQTMHTVFIFEAVSQYKEPWFSWCYAIGVEMAILICIARGWIKLSGVYAFATLCTNLCYEFIPESDATAVLISILLAGTLATYSHLFYETLKREEAQDNAAVSAQIAHEAERLAQERERLAQPYECPECGERFATARQRNGHISGHKQSGTWFPENYPEGWEEPNFSQNGKIKQTEHVN